MRRDDGQVVRQAQRVIGVLQAVALSPIVGGLGTSAVQSSA
jgi:hypothetical protein